MKTEMGKGTTIPKGRFNLPRETKAQTKDRILVFAEGRQAEEAKKAGADIVGGLELVEGVSLVFVAVLGHELIEGGSPDHQRPSPSYYVPLFSLPHPWHHPKAWTCAWSPGFDAFRT